jgi:hypothetical protein
MAAPLRPARVLLGVVALVSAACSRRGDDRGGLMLEIVNDGSLTIAEIRIGVRTGNPERVLMDRNFRIPGEATLPTTLGIVSSGNATETVTIDVSAFGDSLDGLVALDRRDRIVTGVPTDIVLALPIVLTARCSSLVSTTPDGRAKSDCPQASTCASETGQCTSADINAPRDLLPYTPGHENLVLDERGRSVVPCATGRKRCGVECVETDAAHGCSAASCEPCVGPSGSAPFCDGAGTCTFACSGTDKRCGDVCVPSDAAHGCEEPGRCTACDASERCAGAPSRCQCAPLASCGTRYTVGGAVSGLNGTLILQNNGVDNLRLTANGSFTFATPLATGGSYGVTVLMQPAGQTCTVRDGAGTVGAANIRSVVVVCTGAGAPCDAFGPLGKACTRDAQCPPGDDGLGHCVDSVCCNTVCGADASEPTGKRDGLTCSSLYGSIPSSGKDGNPVQQDGTCYSLKPGDPCGDLVSRNPCLWRSAVLLPGGTCPAPQGGDAAHACRDCSPGGAYAGGCPPGTPVCINGGCEACGGDYGSGALACSDPNMPLCVDDGCVECTPTSDALCPGSCARSCCP